MSDEAAVHWSVITLGGSMSASDHAKLSSAIPMDHELGKKPYTNPSSAYLPNNMF